MPKQGSFDRIRNTPLSSQIVVALRRSIFDGHLPPGSPLREQHLAEQFGVSQNTVREALLELQHLGLVERHPNRATYVTQLSEQEIRERLEARVPLERTACVKAASNFTPEDARELAERVDAIARSLRVNDYAGYAAADLEFHRYIWGMAGNRTLYRLLDQITAPLFAFLNMFLHDQAVRLADVDNSHELIVAALQAGDVQRVEATIQEHVAKSYDRVLGSVAQVEKKLKIS